MHTNGVILLDNQVVNRSQLMLIKICFLCNISTSAGRNQCGNSKKGKSKWYDMGHL